MPDDFVIARNPEADSTLPFLIRLPLGANGIVLKVRDTWPRTAKVYCHPAIEWPASPDIIERVPVRSCTRRFPEVPIVFCETRPLAQEWTYRFLGAALAHHLSDQPAGELTDTLPTADPLEPAPPSTAEIRAWAVQQGMPVAAKGRLRPEIIAAFTSAHRSP